MEITSIANLIYRITKLFVLYPFSLKTKIQKFHWIRKHWFTLYIEVYTPNHINNRKAKFINCFYLFVCLFIYLFIAALRGLRISAPRTLGPRQWKRRVLTTGPPGNSRINCFTLNTGFPAWLETYPSQQSLRCEIANQVKPPIIH